MAFVEMFHKTRRALGRTPGANKHKVMQLVYQISKKHHKGPQKCCCKKLRDKRKAPTWIKVKQRQKTSERN